MQPSANWDGFKNRRSAAAGAGVPQGDNLEQQLRDSISRVGGKPGRKPRQAAVNAPALGDVLLSAIRLASARKGAVARETLVREATLLEVLGELMRGAQ
jgi:hypothetical protein